MNQGTWIPGEGWMTFGRAHVWEPEPFVPVSDPDPRSPYHIPSQHVPVEAAAEPVPEPVLTPGERAKAWLAAELAVDPVPSLELQERARKAGITLSTLRRVAKQVPVEVYRDAAQWYWRLPDKDAQ
jgi:hypothetical protein